MDIERARVASMPDIDTAEANTPDSVQKRKLRYIQYIFGQHHKSKKPSTVTSHLLSKLSEQAPQGKKSSIRQKILEMLESCKFEILISALVLVELVIVIAEVAINNTVPCGTIEDLCVKSTRSTTDCAIDPGLRCYASGLDVFCQHYAVRSCHIAEYMGYTSIALLTFFFVELALKLILSPKKFISHFGHVMDIVVVIVSIVLEITHGAMYKGRKFIIILRAWRVVRILHACFEHYHLIFKQDHVIRKCEEALNATLNFLDSKGLHDEFHGFCQESTDI